MIGNYESLVAETKVRDLQLLERENEEKANMYGAVSTETCVAFDPTVATMFYGATTRMSEDHRLDYAGEGHYKISKDLTFKISWDGRKCDGVHHVEVDLSRVDFSQPGTDASQKATEVYTIMVAHGSDDSRNMAQNFNELMDELVEIRAEGITVDNEHHNVETLLGSGTGAYLSLMCVLVVSAS